MNKVKLLVSIVIAASVLGSTNMVHGLDARENIDRAIELIETKNYTLARTYLEPALIDPRLSSGERSRAYYLRGFSFMAQQMPVSARKDYNRALEFNPDNAVVVLELGLLHGAGMGVEKDEALALTLYEQAASLGYERARFHVGRAYLYGQGAVKNLETARAALTEAAQQEHRFAMMNLAASYRIQHVADPQPDLALAWYEKAHAAGESSALLSIGFMHANGEFGMPDLGKAVNYFRKALEEGLTTAAIHLAYAYVTGSGVEKDPKQAFALYTQAADAGIPASYAGLGHLYEFGLGVAKDAEAAKQWYEKGALQGSQDAQLRLVAFYLQRDGQPARAEALKWAQRAADSGGAQARNDYAWLLATSDADELRNGTLALDHAIKAVEQSASAAYLDTLAAAYAELGNFEQAVATQIQAIEALSTDEGELKPELEQHLRAYERGQPWRE